MTLDEAFESWMAVHVSRVRPITITDHRRTYTNHISPILGRYCIADITALTVSDAFIIWRETVSKSVLAEIKKTLHALFAFWVEDGLLIKNPVRKVYVDKSSAPIKILTQEQIATLLTRAKGRKIYPQLLILAMAGIRVAELRGLQWDDVDFANGTLSIRRTFYDGAEHEPKTKKSRRTIDLPDIVLAALRVHPRLDDCKWLFPTQHRLPASHSCLRQTLVNLLRQSGLPHVTLHSFRHAHATHLLESGITLKAIQERGGWSTPTILLERYAHVTRTEKDKTLRLLNGFTTEATRHDLG